MSHSVDTVWPLPDHRGMVETLEMGSEGRQGVNRRIREP